MSTNELSPISVDAAELKQRVARFDELEFNPDRYSDSHTPGAERKIFNVVGSGLEMAGAGESLPAIRVTEGFNVTYVAATPGNGPSLHIHDANETFIVASGHWKVIAGEQEEIEIELGPLDCISVPALVPRRFVNISTGSPDKEDVMIAVLAGDIPRAAFVEARA